MNDTMNAVILEKNKMNILVDHFCKEYHVFAPVTPGFDSLFDEVKSAERVCLDYNSTVLPPKKFFLPPYESLFSFDIKNEQDVIKEFKQDEKKIILGVHPCDMHAIIQLDAFFSENTNDLYYKNRRKDTILAALNCIEPSEYCFCASTGTGPFLEKAYDLLLTDIGEQYLIEIGTRHGERSLQSLNLDTATRAAFSEKKRRAKLAGTKMKKNPDFALLSKKTREKLEHRVWRDLGECGGVAGSFPCLSCGACTFVCPTCYCYDIYDNLDLSLKSGTRKRELDSCQLLEYGEVALGGNFRKNRKDRIRHWMLCKFGSAAGKKQSSCVGCGRCIRICPSKIDITEVANVLRGN